MTDKTTVAAPNATATTPAQPASLDTPITQTVTANSPAPATPAQTDDPLKRIADLETALAKVRQEAAQKRVENREVKAEKSELEKQVEALTTGAKDLASKIEAEKVARETAQREAALVKAMVAFDLPESAKTFFDGVPTEKIEEKAKALKELRGDKPQGGYKSTIGSTGTPPPVSQAQKIFDKMTGKGPSVFDADYHKAVGGGVIEE